MIFPLFWLIFINFFCPIYLKTFLSTVNKYTIIMMIIIIINVKTFLERYFCGISINSFRDLFSTKRGNGSGTTFVAGDTKIKLKNLKT